MFFSPLLSSAETIGRVEMEVGVVTAGIVVDDGNERMEVSVVILNVVEDAKM